MAKRMKRSKIEPAVQTITLLTPPVTSGSTGNFTADLSQMASVLNRRFYRQGLNWAVAGFKFITTAPGNLSIHKLPNTWIMANAWEKSFRAWQRMNNEALAETESVRPRFLDFKVYADSVHHAAGYAGNLLPVDATNNAYVMGEWFASKAVIPVAAGAVEGAVQEREFVAIGANYPGLGASGLNAISLIQGYSNSRGLPYQEDPNTPDAAADADNNTPENWMAALFNDGSAQTDEVLDTMIAENNQAPYPFENDGVNLVTMYPGGETQAPTLEHHDSAIVTATTIGGITHMKGGNFPCGLIRFNWNPTDQTVGLRIEVDLIPGNHRGYLCEPMTEM